MDDEMRRFVVKQLVAAAVTVAAVALAAYLQRETSAPEPFLELRAPKGPRRWSEGRIRNEAQAGIEQAEQKLHREWVRNGIQSERARVGEVDRRHPGGRGWYPATRDE